MAIQIERIEGKHRLNAWLDFPAELYANDPAWVPPLREWLHRRLSPKNPFFKDAELELYAAKRDGRIVGTISALRDRRWESLKGEKTAFFGFLECENDFAVSTALLDTAKERAKAWGSDRIRGPRNLTRIEEVGVTVEGFTTPPPLLASHQPPYYQALIEAAGFEKHHDVLAYDTPLLDAAGNPRSLPQVLQRKAAAVDIPNLTIRRVRYRTLSGDLRAAHSVFTDAYKSVPDTHPMPLEQFLNLGRALVAFTNRDMVQLAFQGEKPIAFAVCLPEINEAVQRAHGHLLPLGWTQFASGLRSLRTASFKLIGVLPEFRASGVHAKLIEHVALGLRHAGYARLEASLIDERNGPMRRVVESAGMDIYRRYRIYDFNL